MISARNKSLSGRVNNYTSKDLSDLIKDIKSDTENTFKETEEDSKNKTFSVSFGNNRKKL